MLQTKLPVPPTPSSALGRPLDPRYLSNIVAVAGAGLAFIFFLAYDRLAGDQLPSSAFSAGIAVFLAWAIGREIDPDRNATGYVAMVIAFISILVFTPSPMLGFGVLIATRLISGTVGLRLGRLDLVVIVVFGALMGSGSNSVAAVAALAIATLVIDRFSRRSMVTAAAATAAGAAVFLLTSPVFIRIAPGDVDLALLVLLMAALAVAVPAPQPSTRTDLRDREISAGRVTVARIVAAGSVVLSFTVAGSAGLRSGFAVVGAAVVAVAMSALVAKIAKMRVRSDIVNPA